MPGLVPGIHVFLLKLMATPDRRRGWPGQPAAQSLWRIARPAMTEKVALSGHWTELRGARQALQQKIQRRFGERVHVGEAIGAAGLQRHDGFDWARRSRCSYGRRHRRSGCRSVRWRRSRRAPRSMQSAAAYGAPPAVHRLPLTAACRRASRRGYRAGPRATAACRRRRRRENKRRRRAPPSSAAEIRPPVEDSATAMVSRRSLSNAPTCSASGTILSWVTSQTVSNFPNSNLRPGAASNSARV